MTLESKILERWPVERWSDLTMVIGCSGGADSTALVLALKRICPTSTTLVLAHWNHKLRGAESEADVAFVRHLARRFSLKFVEGEITNLSQGPLGNQMNDQPSTDEASLRVMRYRFFEQSAYNLGARYVVVGHHADDQVETVLHNLFRGSGLSGLRGMPAFRGLGQDLVLARPMLDVWRSEVLDYLQMHKQSFRTDSSNASRLYTRNRIRNQLLPAIQEHYGRDVRAAIANASGVLGEVFDDIDLQSQSWASENLRNLNDRCFQLAPDSITRTPWQIVQQAIINEYHRRRWSVGGYNRSHWESLRRFFSLEDRSVNCAPMLPDRISVTRTSEGFTFEQRVTSSPTNYLGS